MAGVIATRGQISAILQAQWRSMWNRLPRITKGNIALAVLLGLFWYGIFAAMGFGAAAFASQPDALHYLPIVFSGGLAIALIYWQIIPLLTVSAGSSLELRNLVIYPIPDRALFGIEALLRISTGIEVLIVLLGASVGCLLNPLLPKWAPAGFLLFVVFNVVLAVGVRDALLRLLARRYVREVAWLIFFLMAAGPQMAILLLRKQHVQAMVAHVPTWFLPWTACARIASGLADPRAWIVIAAWIALAYGFGRWQFARSLREVELSRPQIESAGAGRALSWLFAWPAWLFRDPLGGLVEKEIRTLARAPRFRLAFIMGFSFGLVIWVPVAMQHGREAWIRQNFLTVAMAYAVLLLADVLYWNIFGVDRSAAQAWFIYPISLRTVILAKNITTAFFTALDVAVVLVICILLRLPTSPLQIAESLPACLLMGIYLLAVGNLSSAYNPRAADLSQAFRRSGAGKTQWVGLLAFVLAGIPLALASLARYAFDSEWAFFGVIAFMLALGGYLYFLSVETAERVIRERRESALEALSRAASPIAG